MLYLGLGPDEEYDAPAATVATGSAEAGLGLEPVATPTATIPAAVPDASASAVRPIGPSGLPTTEAPKLVPSPLPAPDPNSSYSQGSTNVRPLPASSASTKPQVISPRAFNDAQEIADRFRSHTPVIVNLQEVDRDLSRRLIDFASGLCYGLNGQMEKVADRVYLLTPADVELSAEDRRMLRERGLHDG